MAGPWEKYQSSAAPAPTPVAMPAPGSVDFYHQRWANLSPVQARGLLQKFSAVSPDDPRTQALAKIAGGMPQTKDQQLKAAGQTLADDSDASDLGKGLLGGLRGASFGVADRVAAGLERFLPSAITGNNTDASYGDILKVVRARSEAERNKSTTGNVLGQLAGGLGAGGLAGDAIKAGAGRLAVAASPIASKAGNVLQELMTLKKGQTVRNAAKLVTTGSAAGAAQAAGEGGDPIQGAEYGALGSAVLGTGFKAAQVLTRPFRDFAQLSSAGRILNRLTNSTTDQLATRAQAYRDATGAEPTVFELLPLADRNKILKQAVVGRDNIVETTSNAIRDRAASLGPEMSARARAILQPARTQVENGLMRDITAARGGTAAPEDADLVQRAASNPTDMSEFRDQEARAIMAPHDNTPVADTFGEILPQTPQNINGTVTMTDADPAVTAAIKSSVPGGFRAPDQGVTAGDLSDMIQTLRGDLGKGGIEGRTAQRAIDHLQGELGARAPDAAAAHDQMSDAYAARSRMMEGMQEGAATRLRGDVQVGTSRKQARAVRNAYDTDEGTAGRALGQGNRVLSNLEGSPEEALRSTVQMSRNSTGRQLEQNVGTPEAGQIMAAARAQDESAQALAAASSKAQSGSGDAAGAETLVQAIAGLHPAGFITTKAGAVRKLIDMTYIPENRARTMIDMLFSQDPAMTQRALNAVGKEKNGAKFTRYLAGVTGILSGNGAVTDRLNADEPATPDPQETAIPAGVEAGDATQSAPSDNEGPWAKYQSSGTADTPVDPATSPYAPALQKIYDTESPELLDLIGRVSGQESRGRQHDEHGHPITSKKGAIGIMQVMPDTAPEAAALAGVPFDENAYRNDPAYNKLIGIAYLSQLLRKYDGNVAKATAAYNAGPGAVDRVSKSKNWLASLPAETQDYVDKVA